MAQEKTSNTLTPMAKKPTTECLSESEAPSATIGFRLDESSRDVLKTRANLFGVSIHALARQYVIEALVAQDEKPQIHQALLTISAEVKNLRGDFAHAVQTLLVSAGQIEPQQAEEWVQQNFSIPTE
jgi:hypothetical protein